MNTHWISAFVAATAVFLLQTQLTLAREPNAFPQQTQVTGPASVVAVSNLMGTVVLYPQPQRLGQIKDILLDPQTGQATFALLDAEIPGTAHATLVVPYQALQISVNPADNRQSVVLNVPADRLRYAPRIENNHWEVLKNSWFLEQARNFYSAQTYAAARPIEAPSAAPAASPSRFPQPCVTPANSDLGFTQDLIDFYNE